MLNKVVNFNIKCNIIKNLYVGVAEMFFISFWLMQITSMSALKTHLIVKFRCYITRKLF